MKKNEMGGFAWGGGGVLLGILGGTVLPGSSNHDPISHQKCNFPHPFSHLGLQKLCHHYFRLAHKQKNSSKPF